MTLRQAKILALFAGISLAACGGTESFSAPTGAPAATNVAVRVDPGTVEVIPQGTTKFLASVTGSAVTSVTWSITEVGGGTVDASGLYVAPSGTGTFHVVAKSVADPTISSAAVVTVTTSPTVTVGVSPSSTSVAPSGTVTFSATVSGTADTSVTWTVQETSGCGAISSSGVYTAPTSAATCHVVATSRADPAKSSTATVVVAPAAPPANGAPMTAASRTTGVAPLSVFFDAVDTTPSGVASPFAWSSGVYQPSDYEGTEYFWDFGDTGSGTWTTTGLSRNTATGYTAAHVYENPGTYTASLTITDVSGTVRSYVQTITVGAFGGTTYYVAANGSDSNDGLSTSTPFLTATKGLSMVGTNRRILFRRGDTFSMTSKSISVAGPGIIGAYGSGNRPVLNSSASSGAAFTIRAADWRIMDLTVSGPAGSGAWGVNFQPEVQTTNALLLRLQVPGWTVGVGWSDYGTVLANPHDGATVMECEAFGAQTNGMYVGGRRLAMLGNNIHDPVTSHVLRTWMAHKGVISHNRLWNPGPTRHSLKLHGPTYGGTRPETRWVTVSDNLIRGKTWAVPIGPQDAGQDERVSHVVFERNRTWGEASVQADLMVHARQVMVRNNVFDGTGSYGDYRPITVNQLGIEPPPVDVRVYNNTVVRNDAASSVYGLSISSSSLNVAYRNNLVSAPLSSSKGLLTGAAGSGFVNDHNLLTSAPTFSDPAAGDYTLLPASPAAGAGVSLWEVRSDFRDLPRPSPAAIGAYEVR